MTLPSERVRGAPRLVLPTVGFRALLLVSWAIVCGWPGPRLAAQQSRGAGSDDAGGEWITLFNGRDLDGWTPKITGYALGEDPAETFRVRDGALVVAYDGYETFEGHFGHLFYREPFSRYRLRLQYRFVGEQTPGGPGWALRNSGVMVHAQDPASMGVDQEFPVSIEFQFLGGLGDGVRPTGNLCTPGTHVVMEGELVTRHCTSSASETWSGDAWVSAEIEVDGAGNIHHFVDGRLVLEYERPQLDPDDPDAAALGAVAGQALERGWIALQAESHPVEFRAIELQRLPGG